MLKGYLSCENTRKLLISYINFELKRKDMNKVATHLRNCPKCMQKYTFYKKRKALLEAILPNIEKKIRTELEISSYLDDELSDEMKYLVENMIEADIYYKEEIRKQKAIGAMFLDFCNCEFEEFKPVLSLKMIAKKRLKTINKKKTFSNFTRLFQR